MGIGYEEMLNLTFRQFDYYVRGHERKVERGWDYTRHLISSMFNSSGFAKQKVDASQIMRLPNLDPVKPDKPLRNLSKERINIMLETANSLNSK